MGICRGLDRVKAPSSAVRGGQARKVATMGRPQERRRWDRQGWKGARQRRWHQTRCPEPAPRVPRLTWVRCNPSPLHTTEAPGRSGDRGALRCITVHPSASNGGCGGLGDAGRSYGDDA